MQVWDTNSLAAVCNFGLPDRVFALNMSQVAAVHCLIAVGSAEPQASVHPLTQNCATPFKCLPKDSSLQGRTLGKPVCKATTSTLMCCCRSSCVIWQAAPSLIPWRGTQEQSGRFTGHSPASGISSPVLLMGRCTLGQYNMQPRLGMVTACKLAACRFVLPVHCIFCRQHFKPC